MADEIITDEVAEEAPTTEEIPPETSGEDGAAPETVDEPPSPEALQAQIDELKKIRDKAEADALEWRRKKHEYRTDADRFRKEIETPAPKPADVPQFAEPTPVLENFDTNEEYIAAVAAHEVKKARFQWDQEDTARRQNEQIQQRERDLHEKLQRGYVKYDDFEDVAFAETVPITQIVKDCLAECENPEDVAYYLGKNRAEAIKLSNLTTIGVAREIAKIELTIAGNNPDTPAQNKLTKKKSTKAPPPIKPVGSAGTVEKDPDDMTFAEFEEYRKKQGAKPY